MTAPSPSSRPRVVDAAFWCFVGGAVVMIVGGLMASTASFEAARAYLPASMTDDQVRNYLMLYRGTGIGSIVAAAALAFLAGRARRGDRRFRLATLGLAFATVAVIGLMAIGIGVAHPIVLLSLLPILVGAALIVRPSARDWYAEEATS
ncbi:Uncharacterised protein [Mycolicibacterium aurum]|uniref:Transmembrane protein n=1 Tax=Mycolicibacterium aurum TaxID=1791 RepID=A0A3S4T5X1_MYCAU|nr:hypothetical protein [Mycolicibacterium aurum]VEG51598.1 Uncharacterised protein [Mycolicibacterium aurum]